MMTAMALVELTYFPGEGSHRSPIFVNPQHVGFLLAADSGSNGEQTWLRLVAASGTAGAKDFLVSGSLADVAAALNGGSS